MLKKSLGSGLLAIGAIGLLGTAAFALSNSAMQPTQDSGKVEIQSDADAPTESMKPTFCCGVQRSCCGS